MPHCHCGATATGGMCACYKQETSLGAWPVDTPVNRYNGLSYVMGGAIIGTFIGLTSEDTMDTIFQVAASRGAKGALMGAVAAGLATGALYMYQKT